jgi:hypothetical protein
MKSHLKQELLTYRTQMIDARWNFPRLAQRKWLRSMGIDLQRGRERDVKLRSFENVR